MLCILYSSLTYCSIESAAKPLLLCSRLESAHPRPIPEPEKEKGFEVVGEDRSRVVTAFLSEFFEPVHVPVLVRYTVRVRPPGCVISRPAALC